MNPAESNHDGADLSDLKPLKVLIQQPEAAIEFQG